MPKHRITSERERRRWRRAAFGVAAAFALACGFIAGIVWKFS